jgi:hypothetical protein
MTRYIYEPIVGDTIRLITLFPGSYQDPIVFRLILKELSDVKPIIPSRRLSRDELQATLVGDWKVFETPDGRIFFWPGYGHHVQHEHPDPQYDPNLYSAANEPISEPTSKPTSGYEALSYVWGAMNNLETAFVLSSETGHPSSATDTLEIGENLALALRQLRRPDISRTLWVDAICINQEDIAEREAQVRRMGSIYSKASRVVAWIGPDKPVYELAISTLSYLACQVEISTDGWIFTAPGAAHDEWWRSSYKLPYSEDMIEALTAFYSLPWFERLWVMQEIRLGSCRSVLQLGSREIPYSVILRATRSLDGRVGIPYQLRESVQLTIGVNNITDLTIPQLLRISRTRKCTDPRDKIYGVLSLSPPDFSAKINPQYSLSVTQLYKDIFFIYAERSCRLDLLSQSGSPRDNFTCPSWVPDWAEADVWRLRISAAFQAAGISRPEYQYHDKNDVLDVLGIYCTTIQSVIEPTLSNAERMFETLDPVQLRAGKYPTGESLLQAYGRLVQLDRGIERWPDSGATPKLQTFIDNFPACLPNTWSHRTIGAFSEESPIPCRFLRTENNLCGFCPPTVQSGKKI